MSVSVITSVCMCGCGCVFKTFSWLRIFRAHWSHHLESNNCLLFRLETPVICILKTMADDHWMEIQAMLSNELSKADDAFYKADILRRIMAIKSMFISSSGSGRTW